ncbi:hypothetical protein DL96DRAFT_1620129 [Flagelloscypha sp. PMI_526]|nr:hypothetical protein DL96DRAFT_1620129 [Flagelloscypha sp. PMI_526]
MSKPPPGTSFPLHKLPFDLVRPILEFVALKDSNLGAALCCMSSTTRAWIEPMLYYFVTLHSAAQGIQYYETLKRDNFARIIHLRTLSLNGGWYFFSPHPSVTEIISRATNLRGFRLHYTGLTRSHSFPQQLSSLYTPVPPSLADSSRGISWGVSHHQFTHTYIGSESMGSIGTASTWLSQTSRDEVPSLSHFMLVTQLQRDLLRSVETLKDKIVSRLPYTCEVCVIWANFVDIPNLDYQNSGVGKWTGRTGVLDFLRGRTDRRVLVISMNGWEHIPNFKLDTNKFLLDWPRGMLDKLRDGFGSETEKEVWLKIERVLKDRNVELDKSDLLT